jgi:cystathionine beta-lyase/cystathionine gamma-synthase
MSRSTSYHLTTRAVHAGAHPPRPDFTPTVVPIYPSVTYCYDSMKDLDGVFAGSRQGYVYTRYGNPTVTALEEAVAALEEGETALAFASGMAAIHAALLAVGARAGSAVALLVETISNPLLKVADLPALADIAHRHSASLLVDNTFATPCLLQPLKTGADVVIHSTTKYLGGHGDVLSGVVITSAARRADLFEIIKMTGANLGPQEAWLVLRGIRTLPLRMRQHCENALAVARWLQEHPRVSQVYYPGLPSHPQHELAKRLFDGQGFGGIVSFDLAGADRTSVFCFFEALQLCLPATTLGDVYTLLLYPPHSSHRAISPEERVRIGIGDGLVRMSVGIETVADILSDLEQAMEVLT